jgi:CRP-like cAMP-binding protein
MDLAPGVTLFQVRRRQPIFQEGDDGAFCWLLVSGLAKIAQSTDGGRVIIHRLVGSGELLGGLGAGPDSPAPSTSAHALDPSIVLAIEQPVLERTMQRHPGRARNAVRLLTERLRQMEDDHVRLATCKVEDRLAELLVRLAERVGRACSEGVQLGLTREDLAQMVGTNHFSVSRQLAQWEVEGFLLSRREVVIVRDGAGLLKATRVRMAIEVARRAS